MKNVICVVLNFVQVSGSDLSCTTTTLRRTARRNSRGTDLRVLRGCFLSEESADWEEVLCEDQVPGELNASPCFWPPLGAQSLSRCLEKLCGCYFVLGVGWQGSGLRESQDDTNEDPQ